MYYKEDVKESSDDYMKTYNVMRLGDIAFEGNKSKSYAHGRFVENTIGDGIVSHVFDVFRPIVSYDLNYWKYFINNENVMGRTMARCTKSSTMMTNLVANDFLKENVLVPAIEEQSKIGAYFANLDSLITLHQRECDQLKELKKSMLKKMFPRDESSIPEVRFAGFTDAWEQRKLGDICSEIGDGLHSAPTYDNNGEYYFINGNNLVNGHIEIDELETKRVSSYTFASNDKCLDEKTVLLSINGTIGNLAYYAGEKVMLGKSAAYLKVKDIKKEFLYTSLQTEMILNNFMLSLTGTTIKNLGLEAIKKTSILIPGYDEQTKISKHFNDLDNLITLHQRLYVLVKK